MLKVVLLAVTVLPLIFVGFCVLYLCRLAFAAAGLRRRIVDVKREAGAELEASVTGRTRFVVLIPAHDEALVLAAALQSLQQMRYPRDLWRVFVIADNCSDATATIAEENGAHVMARRDAERIGKGYALEWALQQLAASETKFDAVVILDADTQAAPNILAVFNQAICRGERVLQARYEVLNSGESWRTRLMSCALMLAHIVKPLGREALRLSDGLKGNGMCFTRDVVNTIPWSGASITEDIDYTLRLTRAAYRVAFVPETAVWAQMPVTARESAGQRRRWEGGRYALLKTEAPGLLRSAFTGRLPGVAPTLSGSTRRILADRAAELIIPPFAEMFALPVLMALVCFLIARWSGWVWMGWIGQFWVLLAAAEVAYLLFSLWVSKASVAVVGSVFMAPVYIVWKFGLYIAMAVSRSTGDWHRTERRSL